MAKVSVDLKAIEKFIGGSTEKLEAVMRRSVVEAGTRIIDATPVDTGFAKAGWYPTINGEASDQVFASFSFNGATLGNTVGIASNVAYINRLEYGHSQQAPAGMVRVTAAQWDVIVKEVAIEVRNG